MAHTTDTTDTAEIQLVPLRDIHKGLRSELFALTLAAGRADAADPIDRADLLDQLRETLAFVALHAQHEDDHVLPLVPALRPELADRLAAQHADLDDATDRLLERAAELEGAVADHRSIGQQLYLDLAAFTGAQLTHQDLEERVLVPVLVDALGPEGSLELQQRITADIPPELQSQGLAVMLPALNVDDRAEMLAGMRAEVPPLVFDEIWSFAASVLPAADRAALAGRLGLA